MLLWEKGGRIAHYEVQDDAFVLRGQVGLEDVYAGSDCGLVAVAIDPEWQDNHYIYVAHCLTSEDNVVMRYELDGERYDDVPDSAALVLEVDEPDASKAWHNLGSMGFFDDAEHSMWVLVGEKTVAENSQDLTVNLGKVLRIVPRRGPGTAGSDPHPDNPFAGDPATSSGPDLYAWGLRSPWRGAMDRDGRIFVADVGSSVEEINLVTEPGQNFGWEDLEGRCDDEERDCAEYSDPVASWTRGSGHRYRVDDDDAAPTTKRCAWVGVPYEPNDEDPYDGFLDDAVLFSDMCVGYVRALTVDSDGEVVRNEHVGHMVGLSSAAQGPDGFLYVTSFGSCSSSTGGLGGGLYRVLPRGEDEPGQIDPPWSGEPLVDNQLGPMPPSISQTGIFADEDLTTPIARAIRYEPTLQLWSNGSRKDRWLLLPEGAQVDNADREAWEFPEGTLFFKTFGYEGADGDVSNVETRIIRRTAAGYDYHAYAWKGGDAELLSLESSVRVEVELADGSSLRHAIPSRFDCRSCHESSSNTIIGFDELRLSGPATGQSEPQLELLEEAGVFAQPIPADPEQVTHADALTEEVLGYLHGNCAHCHNGSASSMSSLSLEHDVALASLIDQPTMGSGQAPGIRVVPGSPDQSILYQALSGESEDDELEEMPPLGVQLRDEEMIEQVRAWIEALP